MLTFDKRYCCESGNVIFSWKVTWNYSYSPYKIKLWYLSIFHNKITGYLPRSYWRRVIYNYVRFLCIITKYLVDLVLTQAWDFRNSTMSSRSARRAAGDLSSLLSARESESPLTMSSEDLSTRSASPRFSSTLVDGDKYIVVDGWCGSKGLLPSCKIVEN